MIAEFRCPCCGRVHTGLPTNYGFGLPDVVHELSYLDDYRRTRHNADLCTLDESRYFLRAVLPIPLKSGPVKAEPSEFAWGVWVEITREVHDIYVNGFRADLTALPRAVGHMANNIPGYETALGLPLEIEFQDAGSRPLLWFTKAIHHLLAEEQRHGINSQRHQEILHAVGHFEKGESESEFTDMDDESDELGDNDDASEGDEGDDPEVN